VGENLNLRENSIEFRHKVGKPTRCSETQTIVHSRTVTHKRNSGVAHARVKNA